MTVRRAVGAGASMGAGWVVGRRAVVRHPVQAAVAVAVRSPRATVLVGGVGVATAGVMLLLALASAQAYLVLSGQSSTVAERRFGLFADDSGGSGPDTVAAAAATAALATGRAVDGAGGPHPTAPVTKDQTVVVDGIRVHRSIAVNLEALLDAAADDGITLSGWGWRDTNAQIRLRRQHCGTTEYAIYRMPSSRCSPPTARPGRSQHERGLAIDFTYNGGSISTRRNPGFRWLDANAAAFGFKNLASEPWHWSTTGR